MTYETTYYFYNNVDEKPRETICIVHCESHSFVYHFAYDELTRDLTNDDQLRTFNKDQTLNADIVFDNLVAQAKSKYKYSAMSTSTTYNKVENF